MAKDKIVPRFPGIPSIVTPDIAESLKANHPDLYTLGLDKVVDERLRDWRLENEPNEVAKEDKKREAAQKQADAEAKKAAPAAQQTPKAEGESSPKSNAEEGK